MSHTQQYTTDNNEYAQVISVNYPLVVARGFTNIHPGEMVVFEDKSLGQILSFANDEVKLMAFSKGQLPIGSKLYRTNKQLSFPIYKQLFGCVFNSLGELLISTSKTFDDEKIGFREIYQQPANITQRRRTTKQLITGYSVTDLLLPIGEGQRELLIGDRKSGKENFAKSVAVKQAQMGNKVVYAMIAKTNSNIKQVFDYFVEHKVMDSIVIIATTPKDTISSIVISPFSAMTIAEHLMSQGENIFLILDDLTSQAEFYREISLLAKKFPGRDSYPGDIFFNQAQLLERSGTYIHPTKTDKTVSLTCLPVVRTSNSDLTEFIASNLISITDGHLLFDQRLFNQGVRPAINVGLSVTRVGKQTQSPLQRDMNLKVTSFLANYQKTKNLTHLGSEISEQSQKVLHKGELLTDFFSENNGLPLHVQMILLSMIWLDWFENTHKNVVETCKFELNKQHESNQSVRDQLHTLMENSQTFAELLENIEKDRSSLLKLCQV